MADGSNTGVLDPERMQGQEISGCRIVDKIATGGMGTVYRALQVSMNRPVAIKCLAEDFARDKQYVARFVREARAAGELSHTHLIHVLDVGVHQGVYYYIMEFVDGQSLDRILKIKEKLGPETVTEIVIQAARALSYAHSKGLIHRDIKPDNLMITKEGTVKIADLGIAKKLDPTKEATDAGLVLGTPNYMAPEQATDASLTDKRSDIYALGSTAYHMLAGVPPYTGKNALEILTNVVKKKPAPLETKRKGLPPGLIAILNKMMARSPESRYQAMDELLRDLELYKAGKFQVPKSKAADDDDDDDRKKPSAPIELAEAEDHPSSTMIPPVPAGGAAAASTDDLRKSGSRVMPGGAVMQAQDLSSARAIGAINEKPKSKLIPVITLLGAVALLGIGFLVMKRLTDQKPPEDKGQPKSETRPEQGTETTTPAGSETAQQELADARERERAGAPREVVKKRYEAIAEQYPETDAGKAARADADRIEKDWSAAVDARIADALKLMAGAGDGGSFQPAFDAVKRARAEASGRPDFTKKVTDLEKKIEGTANEKAQLFLQRAQSMAAKRQWIPAVAEARKVLGLEIAKQSEEALKLVSDWRERWRLEEDAAWKKYDRAWFDACEWARGKAEDAKGELRIDKALEMLAEAQKSADFQAIADIVARDVDAMKSAASVYDESFSQAAARKGKEFKFSKQAFASEKPVKIHDVQGKTIWVEFGGRPFKLKPLASEDVRNLTREALEKTAEGRAKYAAYLFVMGETNDARKLLARVDEGAAGLLRRRIDEHLIRALVARGTARNLFEGDELGNWREPKGAWLQQPDGFTGSGDDSQWVLREAPDDYYLFEVEARLDAGVNGCVIFFNLWSQRAQWCVGDGGNTFSCVRGLPQTRTDDVLPTGDPTWLRVVVFRDKAVGFLNGETRWEIWKADNPSAAVGHGLGLGVVRGHVRFRRVRLVQFEK